MLAESSAESAESSKHLLETIQAEVEHGNEVTQQTSESLNKVITLKYLVLEKFLFMRLSDFDEIANLLSEKNVKCWVNMRYLHFPSETTSLCNSRMGLLSPSTGNVEPDAVSNSLSW